MNVPMTNKLISPAINIFCALNIQKDTLRRIFTRITIGQLILLINGRQTIAPNIRLTNF
jgi:hypothetical protein